MRAIEIRAFDHPVALQTPTLCPEIDLWLISEDVDLEAECRALHDGDSPPYWAFCWGSGQALARWLLDHPEEVRERRVVDFGAGSGVAAIAAARAGAASVIAVDIDEAARIVARANARSNDVEIETAAEVPADWDVLLASDVLYEQRLTPVIEGFRETALGRGGRVLVGEPERPGNPGYPDAVLARYAVKTFPDVDSPTGFARVYRLA